MTESSSAEPKGQTKRKHFFVYFLSRRYLNLCTISNIQINRERSVLVLETHMKYSVTGKKITEGKM